MIDSLVVESMNGLRPGEGEETRAGNDRKCPKGARKVVSVEKLSGVETASAEHKTVVAKK